ncbi:hypothetical protein FKP32DRAFT_1575945, partial [Trametes sanguinea]
MCLSPVLSCKPCPLTETVSIGDCLLGRTPLSCCRLVSAHYVLVQGGGLHPAPRQVTSVHLNTMFQFKAVSLGGTYIASGAANVTALFASHECTSRCSEVTYVFQVLSAPRPDPLRIANPSGSSRSVRPTNPKLTLPPSSDLEDAYLEVADEELRRTIISEWEQATSAEALQVLVCAVCGRRTLAEHVTIMKPGRVHLELLRNHELPEEVLPDSYDLAAYEGAILHPKGLINTAGRGDLRVCRECGKHLGKERMPPFALANWLYYGHDKLPGAVRHAFKHSTHVERVLVARARASKISFRFSEIKGHYLYGTSAEASQKCVKGNVAIHPQDSTSLNSVLPPSRDEIQDTICAVFVGENKPTQDNIEKLAPVLVRKSRVKAMIDFLVDYNPKYAVSDTFRGYSQANMDQLFGEGTGSRDEGVPCAMEIGHIQNSPAVAAATEGYVPGEADGPGPMDDELLMENVGYTDGSESPKNYFHMKAKALSHCLRKRGFLQSQAGSRFVPDFENEDLLSWLFPHLDPWGIGGFHCKRRQIPLSMEQQLKYLLTVEESPFREDPDFTFVYYNILQKKAVMKSVAFRVPASQRESVIGQLMAVDINKLDRLIEQFQADAHYKPTDQEEAQILRLLLRINTVSHDLPGSNGYKLMLRNQIRALVNHMGTPTLFITLNPSDRDHPLVRIMAGRDADVEERMRGVELSRWKRTVFAARNPSACARFFDKMITSFIEIILRFGKAGKGLFG